jgi:inorganic pyrophosphatase
VPSTRADDGDPLDVLVLMDAPVFPGCIVPSRLISVIEAEQTDDDKTQRNDRLLAVATNSAAHRSIHQLADLSQDLVAQIEHFFVLYNEAKGKRFKVRGQSDRRRALALVKTAIIGRKRRRS